MPTLFESIVFWYRSIPIITKSFITLTVILSLLKSFNVISPLDMTYNWYLIRYKYQLWRLLTPFVYAGTFNFQLLVVIDSMYVISSTYERKPFNTGAGGTSADYLYMLIFSIISLLIVNYFIKIKILLHSLLCVIIYVWSRKESESLFSSKSNSLYLQWWVCVGISLIAGFSIVSPLMGIIVGQVYYTLIKHLPRYYNINVIHTPKYCNDIITYFNTRLNKVSSN